MTKTPSHQIAKANARAKKKRERMKAEAEKKAAENSDRPAVEGEEVEEAAAYKPFQEPTRQMIVKSKLDVAELSAEELSKFVLSRQHTKLTVNLIDRFFELGAKGLPFDAVCDALRVAKAHFHNWYKRGELFLDGEGGTDPGEAVYGLFVQRLREATAEYRNWMIDELHMRDQGNEWIRVMTILERRDKRNFSRQDLAGMATDATDRNEQFL